MIWGYPGTLGNFHICTALRFWLLQHADAVFQGLARVPAEADDSICLVLIFSIWSVRYKKSGWIRILHSWFEALFGWYNLWAVVYDLEWELTIFHPVHHAETVTKQTYQSLRLREAHFFCTLCRQVCGLFSRIDEGAKAWTSKPNNAMSNPNRGSLRPGISSQQHPPGENRWDRYGPMSG